MSNEVQSTSRFAPKPADAPLSAPLPDVLNPSVLAADTCTLSAPATSPNSHHDRLDVPFPSGDHSSHRVNRSESHPQDLKKSDNIIVTETVDRQTADSGNQRVRKEGAVGDAELTDIGNNGIPPQKFPPLITKGDMAKLLNRSTRTVYRLESQGLIPSSVNVGSQRLWVSEEVDSWIKAGCPKRQIWERQHPKYRKKGR